MDRFVDDENDDDVVGDGQSVTVPTFLTDSVTFGEDGEPRFTRASAGSNQTFDGHRPGFAQLTDEQIAKRRAARDAMIETATQAWKGDAKRRKKNGDDDDDDDDRYKTEIEGSEGQNETDPDEINQSALSVRSRRSDDARSVADRKRAAYESYCAKIRDAWRTPTRDASQPDNSSPPEVMRRFLHGGDDHDAPAMLRRHLQTEGNEENQRRRDTAWEEYRRRLSTRWQPGETNPARADEIERQGEQWRHGR